MKFIWAFDPQRNPKDSLQTIKEVKFWADRFGAVVQPVCILSDAVLYASEINISSASFRTYTKKLVSKYLSLTPVKGFLPPKILRVSSASRRKKALALSEFAKESKASIIFLNSHEKVSFSPIKLGGFCQALIELTHTPLVVLNPSMRHSQKISTVLFPTDFEQPSKKALGEVTPFLKKLKSKVILFNRVEVSIFYLSGAGTMPPLTEAENIIVAIEKMRKKQAHRWQERLNKLHIENAAILQREKMSLAADIVNTARRQKVDLIALVNRRQPQAERFLGSTAREVLMRSSCPVMILR